jgi:hypothetical protein
MALRQARCGGLKWVGDRWPIVSRGRIGGTVIPRFSVQSRHSGSKLACFKPALVANLRRGVAFRLSWSGSPRQLSSHC